MVGERTIMGNPNNGQRQQPLLDVQGLTVNYGGIQALRAIDLTIYPGEVITLIGANGAGKSTTLRAISRIVNPQAGKILAAAGCGVTGGLQQPRCR